MKHVYASQYVIPVDIIDTNENTLEIEHTEYIISLDRYYVLFFFFLRSHLLLILSRVIHSNNLL